MKRVVRIIDCIESVPDNGKYLFSKEVQTPAEETEAQKVERIISGSETTVTSSIYLHYYEVSEEDFKRMIDNGYNEDLAVKLNKFNKEFNILS